MKRIRVKDWAMSLEQFIALKKCHNFKKYIQHTGQFSSRKQIGCDYYIYVSTQTLEVINIYSKGYNGEKYKSFFSSFSAEDCKTKAWNFIQKEIEI